MDARRLQWTRWALPVVLMSALAGVGCGPSQEELDAANEQIRELRNQLSEAESQREALEGRLREVTAQNQAMADRLRAMGVEVEELEGAREELQRALEELRARERQAQARLATFRNLLERFRSMIESGRLRVRIVRNRMVVELPQGILFDPGQTQLKPEGQETLNEVTQILASIQDREFQIAGHTDNRPIRTARFPSNWELSAARGVTVARYMIDQGMPANRISAAGYADTQPVASNDEDDGRAQNRRIEIVLLPNLDELPDLSSLDSSSH